MRVQRETPPMVQRKYGPLAANWVHHCKQQQEQQRMTKYEHDKHLLSKSVFGGFDSSY